MQFFRISDGGSFQGTSKLAKHPLGMREYTLQALKRKNQVSGAQYRT
jgi:hypothetical protein